MLIDPMEINASDETVMDLGIRVGISNPREEFDFESFEVFGNYGLPWGWRTPFEWILGTGINGSVGVLIQEGDTALLATLGPVTSFSSPGSRVTLDIGVGFALISEEKVGDHSFGGPFQFIAHGGVSYRLPWNLALGYQFFHISDGGIFGGNGLNRHLLEISYRF
jgi:hypothetical protein